MLNFSYALCYIHIHRYTYKYVFTCVCVCVFVCAAKNSRHKSTSTVILRCCRRGWYAVKIVNYFGLQKFWRPMNQQQTRTTQTRAHAFLHTKLYTCIHTYIINSHYKLTYAHSQILPKQLWADTRINMYISTHTHTQICVHRPSYLIRGV